MKTSILTVAFLFVAAFSAQAQQVLQESIEITVNVIAPLSIVSSTDIDLGTVISGTPTAIKANANDPIQVVNPGVGAIPGHIVISGADGERISVTYGKATLSNGQLTNVVFSATVFDNAVYVASGDEVTITGGQVTLDIGGFLAAVPGGSEGIYSTTTGGQPLDFIFTYTSI